MDRGGAAVGVSSRPYRSMAGGPAAAGAGAGAGRGLAGVGFGASAVVTDAPGTFRPVWPHALQVIFLPARFAGAARALPQPTHRNRIRSPGDAGGAALGRRIVWPHPAQTTFCPAIASPATSSTPQPGHWNLIAMTGPRRRRSEGRGGRPPRE